MLLFKVRPGRGRDRGHFTGPGKGGQRHDGLGSCCFKFNFDVITVCFFVLCNQHWFNRVPGANLGVACLPFTLTLTLTVPMYPPGLWLWSLVFPDCVGIRNFLRAVRAVSVTQPSNMFYVL